MLLRVGLFVSFSAAYCCAISPEVKMVADREGLTPAEAYVLEKASRSEWADLEEWAKEQKLDCSPTGDWEVCMVRGSKLRDFCVKPDLRRFVHPASGVSLRRGTIHEILDLSFEAVGFPIRFERCEFLDRIHLYAAELRLFELKSCNVQGGQDVGLPTILADQAQFTCDLRVYGDSVVHGKIQLIGARIAGNLRLEGTELRYPLGFEPAYRPYDPAGIDPASVMLLAQGAQIRGNVWLEGTVSEAAADIAYADVGGTVDCQGAKFGNGVVALLAEGIAVEENVKLDEASFSGQTSFRRADIEGNLIARRGRFEAAEGAALVLDGARVRGRVQLDDRVTSNGTLSLVGTTIEGGLDLRGARIGTEGELALDMRAAKIGEVDFTGAVLFGRVECRQATVRGMFQWREIIQEELDELDMRFAHLGWLRDDAGSWPRSIRLDGLVYDQIDISGGSPGPGRVPSLDQRLDGWLKTSPLEGEQEPVYRSQPYEQLAGVLQAMGRSRDAEKVRIASRRHRVDSTARPEGGLAGILHHVRRAVDTIYRWTTGYGYEPERTLGWLAGLAVVGTIVFGISQRAQRLRPSRSSATDDSVKFNAFMYSLDVLLPVINLGQAEARNPQSGLIRGYYWIHLLGGWALSTLLLVGLSGLVRG